MLRDDKKALSLALVALGTVALLAFAAGWYLWRWLA